VRLKGNLLTKSAVRQLEAKEYDAWDKFVAQSRQGTLFHKSYWLGAAGKEFKIYGCFKGGELLAGLPIICDVSMLGVKYAHHPPLTPYLGVVFKDSEAKYVKRISDEKSMSKAIATRIKKDFDSIHFNFTPFATDLQPFIWEGFSSGVRYTYLLELADMENVWKGMDAKRRNDITRAEKDGIYVESSNDFKQTFDLVEKTFDRQGKEFTTDAFRNAAFKYNEVLNQKGQCNSFLAKNRDAKTIAVVYIVWDEKRSYYLLGGYNFEERHHGASAIAMWEAIKFTKNELGLNEFDFEGSMIKPVERFFRAFGGQQTPYFCVSQDLRNPLIKIAERTNQMLGRLAYKFGLRR